jgi:hypothetical protein
MANTSETKKAFEGTLVQDWMLPIINKTLDGLQRQTRSETVVIQSRTRKRTDHLSLQQP